MMRVVLPLSPPSWFLLFRVSQIQCDQLGQVIYLCLRKEKLKTQLGNILVGQILNDLVVHLHNYKCTL